MPRKGDPVKEVRGNSCLRKTGEALQSFLIRNDLLKERGTGDTSPKLLFSGQRLNL